jgi:putative FmdB family regulatory protein
MIAGKWPGGLTAAGASLKRIRREAMPLYEYRCADCAIVDKRIAGFDDACAVCHACGGLMVRLTDPFTVLWDEELKCQNLQKK